jgi:hypothetical protein
VASKHFSSPNQITAALFYWSKIALGATFAAIGAFRDKNQSQRNPPGGTVTPIVPYIERNAVEVDREATWIEGTKIRKTTGSLRASSITRFDDGFILSRRCDNVRKIPG